MFRQRFFLLPLLSTFTLLPATDAPAFDVVRAQVRFNGNIANTRNRQTIGGFFAGRGRISGIRSSVTVGGSLRTLPGERTPRRNLLGDYQTEMSVRARKFGASVSRSFRIRADLRQGSIRFGENGRVILNRRINPRRMGRQRIRGIGYFRLRI